MVDLPLIGPTTKWDTAAVHGYVAAIDYYLPTHTLTDQELARRFPDWRVDRICAKIGIHSRHFAGDQEFTSDLAVKAATQLFERNVCSPDEIDFLLLCTQTSDYALPTTACLVQNKLGLSTATAALDYNLGCSGFVYGLGIAESLIVSGQARAVLLITSDTYSKYMSTSDKQTVLLFGDGAAATLILSRPTRAVRIGPFVYGTDGSGYPHLIAPHTGTRGLLASRISREVEARSSLSRDSPNHLVMNGEAMFEFALREVPKAVGTLLRRASITLEDVDMFVFHQANAYLLQELRRIIGIPPNKFQLTLEWCGNTVSSSIPIALRTADTQHQLKDGDRVMVIGFGVGLSWAASLIRWTRLV